MLRTDPFVAKNAISARNVNTLLPNQAPVTNIPLNKKMFIKRFLKGESLRSIEGTKIKKYKKRPSNVTMIYWLKRLDKMIKNQIDEKEKCHFNPQDAKKIQELIDFLDGRSLRKVKQTEREKVGLRYVYIIFKLMDVIFSDKKVIKKQISVKKHKSEEMNAEDRYLEQIYKTFHTKKHRF